MAQKDSQLVIRARDEASKALAAISKALTDFVSAQTDAAKVSGATSGTLAKLGQSLNDLGRSATALTGVSKIATQLERGQQAVSALETKLAQASSELTQFQGRADQAATAATALAAKSEAATTAEQAQAAIVKALAEAHVKNTREIRAEEVALQKLAERMTKAPTRPPAMVEYQTRLTALDTRQVEASDTRIKLDAERAALERLTAARKADDVVLAAARKEQGSFAEATKTAQGNVENLTAGLERSRGALGEIKTMFEQGAKAAGLSSASVEALAARQEQLRIATQNTTAVIETQSKAEGVAASAARALAFQKALKTAAPLPPEPEAPVRARGVLAREADRQRAATDAAASAEARERVQLDALGKSLDNAARSRARAAPVAPLAGVGATPGVAAAFTPGVGVAPVVTTAAATTALYREQAQAVDLATAAFKTAQTRLTELHREMAATGQTVEQTAAINAQRIVVEAAEAAQKRETAQLEAFQAAIRAATAARRDAARAAGDTRAAQFVADVTGTQPRPGPLGAPAAAAPIGPAAAATQAYRDQVRAVDEASDAYLRAQVTLKRQQAALTDLYRTQATVGTAVEGLSEKIREQTAAIAAQQKATDAARETMQRETAALSAARAPLTETIAARKAQAAAEIEYARRAAEAGRLAADAATAGRAAAVRADEIGQQGLLGRVIQGVSDARKAYNATLSEESSQHNELISHLKNLAGAYLTVFTAINAFKSVITTAADTEAAQIRIATALGGNQEQGAIAYEHAANAARALRLDILPTVDAYGKLLAVVKDTPLEGRNATRAFDDLLVTIRAFKLSPDAMQRVILALTDMAARGNIARKELNQLDLALPVGLRQALASSAGYGANQMELFNKAIHDGRIGLDLLVPALDIVADRARGGLGDALKTAQSSFAAFRNALFDFKNAIAEGGFLQGVTEGVNGLSAVLRDPAASEGLKGIAAGFGKILSLIGLVVPYARELFLIFSAFASVKLVGMIFGFQSIYRVIGLIGGLIATAFSGAGLLSFAAILTSIEGGLIAIGAALLGPLGIAVAVAVIGGAIAYWLTGTKSAEEGLASYKRTLDSIKGSLQESGGDATKIGKGVGDLTVSQVETELTAQKKYFDQTSSSVDSLGAKIKTVAAGLALSGQAPPVLVNELTQLGELFQKYKDGGISAAAFQSKIEDLNKTFTNGEVKGYAAELSAAAAKQVIFSDNVLVLEGALIRAGVKLDLDAGKAKLATDAFDDMWKKASQNGPAIDALDKYGKAMDALAQKIPALKAQLDLTATVDESKKELAAGLKDIDEKLAAGSISPQQAEGRRRDIINREALAEADAAAKNYQRQSSRPDQISDAYQFLQENKTRAGVETGNLAPEWAVSLTEAIKEIKSTLGISVQLSSGYRDPNYLQRTGQGTPEAQAYDAAGKSPHSAGIGADWYAAGVAAGTEEAKKIDEIFAKHGAYNPYGYTNTGEFNHLQGIPNRNFDQATVDAMNEARSRGAPISTIQAIALPAGQSKKTLESANADRSRDENDRLKSNEAALKGLELAKETLQTELARDSVDKGIADYKKSHVNASQDELNTEKKRLIVAQSNMEIEADVEKFRFAHPPASASEEDILARQKEVDAYRALQVQIHASRLERALDNVAAKDTTRTAAAELSQLNSLVTERKSLLKEKAFATETGDETKLDAVNSKLDTNKTKIEEVTAELRKMYEALGGDAATRGIAKLNAITAGLDSAHTKVQIFGLSVNQTRELANDFVNDVTSGVDTFAQEIADGVAPIQALGDAFRKFASDFLRQIAEMIIKAQLFKLLGLTESGAASGGGLLGGLSGATSAAGSASGGGFFSSIGGFFSHLFGGGAAAVAHEGGLVGSLTTTRAVSPLAFAGAARYASGGVVGFAPDEYPIVAHRNEEILRGDNPRHRDNIGKGDMAVSDIVKQPKILNFWNVEDLLSAALNTPEGEKAIINHVRTNAGAFKGAIGG